MKQRLMRPTAALFPIAGIIGALWGNLERTGAVFAFYFLLQIFSLCTEDCFRNAAAQEPGIRRVDLRFGAAFLPLIAGVCIARAFWEIAIASRWTLIGWQGAFIVASLLYFEHLFEERMYALGRRMDGVILSCIANGLLLAGLLMDASNAPSAYRSNLYSIIATGLGALIAVITAYAIEPNHGFSWKPINLRFAGTAVPQTLLYIMADLIVMGILGVRIADALLPFLFGLIPWRLARTTCRRTADESRALNLLLIAFAAIPAAAAAWLPQLQLSALSGGIALLCAAAVFCAPGKRLYIGIALTAATFIPFPIPYINAALALAAIMINTKQAFLRKV